MLSVVIKPYEKYHPDVNMTHVVGTVFDVTWSSNCPFCAAAKERPQALCPPHFVSSSTPLCLDKFLILYAFEIYECGEYIFTAFMVWLFLLTYPPPTPTENKLNRE